jgi:hypothetical protein
MRIALGSGGSLPGLDPDHLPAAVRAAVRAGLVRRLGALALRAGHETLRDKAQVAAPIALRRMGCAFLGFTGQWGSLFSTE